MMQTVITENEATPVRAAKIESLGKRIADLRNRKGWTQQALANRLAISRVAVSHIESELTVPSERTVTMLAGLFKLSPFQLVEGTGYPKAKAERLPEISCSYTQAEVNLLLLQNDLEWLNRLGAHSENSRYIDEVIQIWSPVLELGLFEIMDKAEREIWNTAREKLLTLESGHP